MDLVIGSHVSFTSQEQLLGSVKESLRYNSDTFMFYTGAPQNTRRAVINDSLTIKAYELMKENDMKLENVIVHAPYIVNLANKKDDEKFSFSVRFLEEEIRRCEQLNITKLVLHPGSHVGEGSEVGIDNIITALNRILTKDQTVVICLETMAGKGTEVGRSFEEIKEIIDGVTYKEKIGVCLDTCHVHDAGYDVTDFNKLLDHFDNVVGIDRLQCMHINDSKNIIEAHKDRHENFGKGYLGYDTLMDIIYNERTSGIPKILETPFITEDDESKKRVYAPYKEEIEMIRQKQFDEDFIEKIREKNKAV